jgi:Inclusion body protein
MVTIDILVAIDTVKLRKEINNPSQDPAHPTGLAHVFQYLIASNSRDAGMPFFLFLFSIFSFLFFFFYSWHPS